MPELPAEVWQEIVNKKLRYEQWEIIFTRIRSFMARRDWVPITLTGRRHRTFGTVTLRRISNDCLFISIEPISSTSYA